MFRRLSLLLFVLLIGCGDSTSDAGHVTPDAGT